MKKVFFALAAMFLSLAASAQGYLSGSNSYSTYFNGGHEDNTLGFQIGYVNKVWSTKINGKTVKENFWGEPDKRLHGFQMGLIYEPTLDMGLGLHTGLFYELYYSSSDVLRREYDCDNYTEHDLYIPLHVMYRFPITADSSFKVYGGVGMTYAMSGEYREWDRRWGESYPSGFESFGDGFPKRCNFQAEVGAAVRIKQVQVGFNYGFGLTNHNLYQDSKTGMSLDTKQDRMNISVAFVM